MSLPAILGTTLSTVPARVPYLPIDPALVQQWRSILSRALGVDVAPGAGCAPSARDSAGRGARPFLIGVAWQGNPSHRLDRWRSFPLTQLAPLAALPGVRLISLQAVDGLDQLRAPDLPFPVLELENGRPRDFLDTAALISLLDLVITPDTSVAHLAGGLAQRVWLALSTVPEWRWMIEREDTPWYPTIRLFRQKTLGDWGDVFQRMAAALAQELAASSPSTPEAP
jgi:hypothetical protein